jgi:predicted transcriptional regulator
MWLCLSSEHVLVVDKVACDIEAYANDCVDDFNIHNEVACMQVFVDSDRSIYLCNTIVIMMSNNSDNSIKYLSELGLSSDEIAVYLYLLENGTKTALEIARGTNLARTKIYRITETLGNRQIVVEQVDNRGSKFAAVHPESFESMISAERAKLDEKQAMLKVLVPELESRMSTLQESSHVRFYRGLDGLKQVTWNSLKAKGELLTYEIGNLDHFIPQKGQAEDLRQRFLEKKIKIRTLQNQEEMEGWTDVSEMIRKYWEARHISRETLTITSDILIYNNVYTMYRFQDDDIFCVEVYNQQLVDMQRQIFEVLWNMASKYDVLDARGKIKLAKNK